MWGITAKHRRHRRLRPATIHGRNRQRRRVGFSGWRPTTTSVENPVDSDGNTGLLRHPDA